MTTLSRILAVIFGGPMLLGSAPLFAQTPVAPASVAGDKCAALVQADFSSIPEAETKIVSAKLVTDGKLPTYCHVTGIIAPKVGFEVVLPLAGWNGKYLQSGSGAMGGYSPVEFGMCTPSLRRGYACAATDTGHKGEIFGGKWAAGDLQALIDFSFRANHVTAVASKAVIERFYGVKPRLSYFYGVSTGGTNALTEAQRYPQDFNAIIAGAPGPDFTGIVLHYLWAGRALRGPNGDSLLSAADLKFVNSAVVGACDMDDGVKDGIIGDFRACAFQPVELLCKPGQKSKCLSSAQVVALNKMYSGPTDSKGRLLYTGGAAKGSELNWLNDSGGGYLKEKNKGDSKDINLADDIVRYFSFLPAKGADWHADQFDFDTDVARLNTVRHISGAFNPDLRQFKALGGKLLMYQGANDESDIPMDAIDYYEITTRTMGGEAATKDFFRFFFVPGMNHGFFGVGAWAVDWLTVMENWVEKNEVPERLVGLHPQVDPPVSFDIPFDTLKPAFTRPIYAWPVRAVYTGKGDPNDAENFVPVRP